MIRTVSSFGTGFNGTIDKLHAMKLLTNDKKLISENLNLIVNGLQCVFARSPREHFENAILTYQYGTIGERLTSTSRLILDNDNHFNLFSNLSNAT